MRVKMSRKSAKEYMCCCCHVRTGTIILGCFQLIVALLALFCLTVAFFYPELMPTKTLTNISEFTNTDVDISSSVTPTEDTDRIQPDYPYMYDSWNWVNDSNANFENQCFGLFVTFLFLVATLMLVYGAVRGIASFLMPYFVLQVFDFALTCLTVLGYFSTIIDIKQFLTEFAKKVDMPASWKDAILNLDSHWLTLIVATCVVCYLVFKAYLINVVYSCYKYLVYVKTSQRVVEGVTQLMDSDDTQLLLPPKYEEVVGVEQQAPPPYSPA